MIVHHDDVIHDILGNVSKSADECAGHVVRRQDDDRAWPGCSFQEMSARSGCVPSRQFAFAGSITLAAVSVKSGIGQIGWQVKLDEAVAFTTASPVQLAPQ